MELNDLSHIVSGAIMIEDTEQTHMILSSDNT